MPRFTRRAFAATLLAAPLLLGACTMLFRHVPEPPASEFGPGPRPSASGAFTVTLEPSAPLKVGPLQRVNVRVQSPDGQPVQAATLTIGGGMPQHGHGLPTRPRVTGSAGPGVYVVDGVRFNMGGWWEFKVGVTAGAVRDSVTFNVRL